jgi:hypothetical protein
LALLQQPGLEKAAAAVGISAVTAWRITKTPEFEKEYRRARRDGYSQAIARLQQASGAAASILLKLMVDPETPAASKLRAASNVLNVAIRAIEREDIEARLSALEQALGLTNAASK